MCTPVVQWWIEQGGGFNGCWYKTGNGNDGGSGKGVMERPAAGDGDGGGAAAAAWQGVRGIEEKV